MFSMLASKYTKSAYKLNCSENEMHFIISAKNALQPSQNQFLKYSIALFWCMYDASCAVYYPDQQMHNIYMYIYINNILYNINTPTCFSVSATSSGNLILVLW